jgi:hypothetical protein
MKTKHAKPSPEGPSATLLSNTQSAIEQRLGPIEYRAPGDLTPYEGNPRKHPEGTVRLTRMWFVRIAIGRNLDPDPEPPREHRQVFR